MNFREKNVLPARAQSQSKLLLLAIFVCALIATIGLTACAEQKKQVDVPDVVGMTQNDAQRVIENSGLAVGTISESFSDSVDQGDIISQDPSKGTKVDENSEISLIVSKGSDRTVAIPNLIGMTQAQAEETLIAVGLVPKAADAVYSDTAPAGKIFIQSVPAGTSVTPGTSVTFTAALGQQTFTVPSVVGLTKDDATKLLTDASFNVDIIEQYNPTIVAGLVMVQSPEANMVILHGSTVTLVISKGPAPETKVAVPNFITLTLAQAQVSAESAGLIIETTGDTSAGLVVSQYPAIGVQVDKGTTVKLEFETILSTGAQ